MDLNMDLNSVIHSIIICLTIRLCIKTRIKRVVCRLPYKVCFCTYRLLFMDHCLSKWNYQHNSKWRQSSRAIRYKWFFLLVSSSLIKIHLFRSHKIQFVLKHEVKFNRVLKFWLRRFTLRSKNAHKVIALQKERSNQMKSVNLKTW